MSLELFPQSIEVLPGVRQGFAARTTDRKPLWANVPNVGTSLSVVDPDYSVRYVRGLSVSGEGALQLVGGVGSVEWTMNANGMPTSPSDIGLRWRFYFDGTTPKAHEYFVYIKSTTISIENTGGVIATINYNVAIGDVFRVELASGFRLFINGELKHSLTTFASAIKYPAQYDAFANDIVTVAPPIIPAPRLEGDWQLRPVVKFVTPTEGSLSSLGPALTTEFFNGQVPGQYPLVGQIDPGIDVWVEDAAPAGASVSFSPAGWAFGSLSPSQISGTQRLKSPLAAGHHFYEFTGATATFQINKDDVLTCYVFLDSTNPPAEIMLQWRATDATGPDHRAYWGANSIVAGIDGQPSRRFMGQLPATNQWVRLEVPASLVDLEGRVINGMNFSLFDGVCSFDQLGKYPGQLQRAESLITIPPLKIIGDLVRTFQPSQKERLLTNYDVGTPPTWSVVSGGGSFSGNEFTAPSAPGTTVVRASGSGNQVADLTINVPAVITPAFRFAGPTEQIDFDTNIGPMPVFIAAGTMAEGIGDITPSVPLGIQEKDVLFLVVESANETVPTPTDWAIVADSPQGTGAAGGATSTRLSVFWRRVPFGGVVAAPTITDPGDHAIGQIFAYRNCIDTGNPWDVTAGDTAASSTSVSIPGDTTTVPNCLVLALIAHQTDTATPQISAIANTDLANLIERADVATTQGNGGGFALIEGQKAVAGAYGATSATLANASVQGRISIALRPALVAWSATAGSMNSSSGLWQAPAVTDADTPVKITATNGTFSVTIRVFVLPLFPYNNPTLPVSWRRTRKALISTSEDRTSRIVREKAAPYDAYEVRFTQRTLAQSNDIDAFWDQQGYGSPFILEDKERGVRKVGWFDSEIAHEGYEVNAQDLSFRFEEAPL